MHSEAKQELKDILPKAEEALVVKCQPNGDFFVGEVLTGRYEEILTGRSKETHGFLYHGEYLSEAASRHAQQMYSITKYAETAAKYLHCRDGGSIIQAYYINSCKEWSSEHGFFRTEGLFIPKRVGDILRRQGYIKEESQ